MEWRKNEGYIITNSISIGDSEIVLGVHETRPNDFVTWECRNKNNYMYWILNHMHNYCIGYKVTYYKDAYSDLITEEVK